ncbi:hypothetical protein ADU37_CDS00960 [Thermococcus sp. 2319x1]|nr:hypothetical protein ADU37_CDS00960 [Thermococcus sp. 2319x1]
MCPYENIFFLPVEIYEVGLITSQYKRANLNPNRGLTVPKSTIRKFPTVIPLRRLYQKTG